MVLFSSIVSCYLKSDKIWILFLDLVGNSEADPGKGPEGAGLSRYVWTKLRPDRSKKNFLRPPPLSKDLDPPLQLVP